MAGRGGARQKPGDFSKRKQITLRLAALIKNLERAPDDNIAIDKFFEILVIKMEKRLSHMADVRANREARNRINREKEAARVKLEVVSNATEESGSGQNEEGHGGGDEANAGKAEESPGEETKDPVNAPSGKHVPVKPNVRQPAKTAKGGKA